MGRSGINRLTKLAIEGFARAAKPGEKKADGSGLYVFKTAAGATTWRLDYRVHDATKGRAVGKTLSIGVYPTITAEQARAARDEAKGLLRVGTDPMVEKKIARLTVATATATTFGVCAEAWLAKMKPQWRDVHYLKSRAALERDVFPTLKDVPIDQITTPMLTDVIERISARGAVETAGRVLQHVAGIMDLAKTRGAKFSENPAHAVKAAIQPRPDPTHHAALHDVDALGDVLRRFDASSASRVVAMAHRLVAYTAARVGNVQRATWSQFHLDDGDARWVIPRSEMKVQRGRTLPHTIILGPSITGALREWKGRTGGKGLLFKSPTGSGEPITRESLEKAYRSGLALSGVHSLHGWRSSFATITKERGFNRDTVELALDHVGDESVVRSYDRGERLDERRRLMWWWDGELSKAEHKSDTSDANVLPFERAG